MSDDIRKEDEALEESSIPDSFKENLRVKKRQGGKLSNAKKLLIAAVAVVLGAGLVFGLMALFNRQAEEEPVPTSGNPKLVDVGRTDVVRIEVNNGETIVVNRVGEEDVFTMEGMDDSKLEQDACKSLFANFTTLQTAGIVEENPSDLAMYGLAEPRSTVKVSFRDGSEKTFYLGDQVATSINCYLMMEGDPVVYLGQGVTATRMTNDRKSYRSIRLTEVDVDNGTNLIVKTRGGDKWTLRKRDETMTGITYNVWAIVEPAEFDGSFNTIYTLAQGIAAVRLDGFYGELASQAELAALGLDDPMYSLTYKDTSNASRKLHVGNDAGDGLVYVRIDDSLDVFLAESRYFDFMKGFDERTLIDQFTAIVNINTVESLTVTDGTASHTMHMTRQEQFDDEGELKVFSNGLPDYLTHYFIDGKEVEETPFKRAYQAVIGVYVTGFTEEAKVNTAAKPVLSVSFNLNIMDEPVVVDYLPYDINNYAVLRNDICLQSVRKTDVDGIMDTLQQLYDGTLVTD